MCMCTPNMYMCTPGCWSPLAAPRAVLQLAGFTATGLASSPLPFTLAVVGSSTPVAPRAKQHRKAAIAHQTLRTNMSKIKPRRTPTYPL